MFISYIINLYYIYTVIYFYRPIKEAASTVGIYNNNTPNFGLDTPNVYKEGDWKKYTRNMKYEV